MKHPVTTTLTLRELERLKKAKGEASMLEFTRDAIMEKCDRCLNDGKPEKTQRNNFRNTKNDPNSAGGNEEIIDDLDA